MYFQSGGSSPSRRWSLRRFDSCARRKEAPRAFTWRHPPRRSLPGALSWTASTFQVQRRSRATPRLESAARNRFRFAANRKAPSHGLESGRKKARVFPPRTHRRWRLFLFCAFLRRTPCAWRGRGDLPSWGGIHCRDRAQKYLRRAVPSGKKRQPWRPRPAKFSEARGMSLAHRIIPCLDTDGERVVKGVNFVGLRDAGDPVALAARYNTEGADELVVLDIAASRDRRPTFLETIRRVAAELAIPLTAGGGIRTLEDGRAVVRAGADKVTANTAAVERPELISELSQEFGAQAVVLAIDGKRAGDHWDVMVRGGRASASLNAVAWARRGVGTGAGEILLTSMDKDGTQSGFDVPLTAAISGQVSVPVIASGGAKTPEDFAEIFAMGLADAALAASIFHDGVQSIRKLKEFLAAKNIEVRFPC